MAHTGISRLLALQCLGTRAGSVRLAGVVSPAQRRAERLQASWASSNAGVNLSLTPASISPRRAAASLTTTADVAMSACTRATRTRSAGSGWLARVRWAWISQAPSAAARRMAGRLRPVAGWVGSVDPPRPRGTGSELLDSVESGNHAPRRLDLQHGRSLNEGLASPRTHFQTMLKVTLIPGQGHRGCVCGDIQVASAKAPADTPTTSPISGGNSAAPSAMPQGHSIARRASQAATSLLSTEAADSPR